MVELEYSREYIKYVLDGAYWRANEWDYAKPLNELETSHLDNLKRYLLFDNVAERYHAMALVYLARNTPFEPAGNGSTRNNFFKYRQIIKQKPDAWMRQTPLFKSIVVLLERRAAEEKAKLVQANQAIQSEILSSSDSLISKIRKNIEDLPMSWGLPTNDPNDPRISRFDRPYLFAIKDTLQMIDNATKVDAPEQPKSTYKTDDWYGNGPEMYPHH